MLKQSLSLLLPAFLIACGSGGGDSYSPFGGTDAPTSVRIGKPYTIKGITYKPKYEPNYVETGEASWYGPNFHGRMTANGERYDQEGLTAAHRTLPLPSMVRVTRLDTGKSIIIRVNDRGPFAHNRIIDLSKGSARALDMLGRGKARVKVEYLQKETEYYLASVGITRPTWMTPSSSDGYYTSVIPAQKPNTKRVSPSYSEPSQRQEHKPTYVLQEGYNTSPFSVVD